MTVVIDAEKIRDLAVSVEHCRMWTSISDHCWGASDMKVFQEPELIRDLKPYDATLYENIVYAELAVYVLDLLQKNNIPTSLENISVALFRLFPEKFSLTGYPQYPDVTRINRTLLQLRPKYRNWASGKIITGVSLTRNGARKAQDVQLKLSGVVQQTPSKRSKSAANPVTLEIDKELQRIEASALFERWKRGVMEQATTMEFLLMIGAYSYTPPNAIRDRVDYLMQIASQFNRDDILHFLKDLRKRFANKFSE